MRRLGEVLGINRRIDAKRSSPRLWPGHLAESEIGVSYETLDRLFKLRLEEGLEVPAIDAKMSLSRANLEAILSRVSGLRAQEADGRDLQASLSSKLEFDVERAI